MSVETLRYLVPYSELIAAITGTFFYYKYKNTSWKYFLFYLWLVVAIEFTGGFIKDNKILVYIDEKGLIYNKWIYNSYRFIAFNSFFFIYNKAFKNKTFKNTVKTFSILYTTTFIFNWIFIQSFIKESSELPKIIGALFLITTIILYFIELLRSNKVFIYYKMISFWISVGLLIYYTGNIPFTLKWNTYMLFPKLHNLFIIVYVLAITMYLIFTFGFIWSNKEEKNE